GETDAEAMAGEWYVKADAVDANGEIVYKDEDLFGIGYFHLDTYNTASNSTTEMWVNDNGNFWDFKNKINVDLNTLTFSAPDAQNESYDSKVTIENGKILLGAAKTPSGMPADSIIFIAKFDDDPYPQRYGYYGYKISGFRFTGFAADN
ncbi:MAG: lipid-binding protein, partial [Petrimonas sp.]|nr:lipid-binding protein [Petrimonas sp.]